MTSKPPKRSEQRAALDREIAAAVYNHLAACFDCTAAEVEREVLQPGSVGGPVGAQIRAALARISALSAANGSRSRR